MRAALFLPSGNANDGVMCPVSTTYAPIPALRDAAPELAAEWEPRLTAPDYNPGALAGMAMAERQGVRRSRQRHARGAARRRVLRALRAQVVLLLSAVRRVPGARGGARRVSCFLVERGPGMEFQRLKDKLGTRSLPSSEVKFRGARGRLMGEEGRGVPAIIRMVNHTRLDCLLRSASGLRRGAVEAIHHARYHSAFGAPLAEQPAMVNVLADLALESEAATTAAPRVARSFDEPGEAPFRRFATAVMKYWVCKRAPGHAAEALECLGGNGFVEDSGMPLLYRDAPLNSIWEGSGNVLALDVLRAMIKEPDGLPAFVGECEQAAGADARFGAHLARVREQSNGVFAGEGSGEQRLYDGQFQARRVVEDLALALQASLLLRHAPPPVAEPFCAARLAGDRGRVYGTLPAGVDAGAIIDRAYPA